MGRDSPIRHRVFVGVLLLVAGAVVNVVVAWACVAFGTLESVRTGTATGYNEWTPAYRSGAPGSLRQPMRSSGEAALA